MEKIKVGVVGATGYAGAEICRLLYAHPMAELAAISSVSFEGMALSDVYPAYRALCDLVCETQADVVEKERRDFRPRCRTAFRRSLRRNAMRKTRRLSISARTSA